MAAPACPKASSEPCVLYSCSDLTSDALSRRGMQRACSALVRLCACASGDKLVRRCYLSSLPVRAANCSNRIAFQATPWPVLTVRQPEHSWGDAFPEDRPTTTGASQPATGAGDACDSRRQVFLSGLMDTPEDDLEQRCHCAGNPGRSSCTVAGRRTLYVRRAACARVTVVLHCTMPSGLEQHNCFQRRARTNHSPRTSSHFRVRWFCEQAVHDGLEVPGLQICRSFFL